MTQSVDRIAKISTYLTEWGGPLAVTVWALPVRLNTLLNYEKLTKATQKCSAEIQQIKHARHAFNAKQSQSSIVSITLIQTSMTAVQAELMNNIGTACIQ